MINGSLVNKAITIVNTAINNATPTLFLEISSYSSKFLVNLENKLYAAKTMVAPKLYPKIKNIPKYLNISNHNITMDEFLVESNLIVDDKGSMMPKTMYEIENIVPLKNIINDKF